MSLSVDDDFLDAIAHQARVAYATQQLHACRTTLQRWQANAGGEMSAGDSTRGQHELAYYAQQVERWQNYLRHLGEGLNVLGSAQALRVLNVPPHE
jgi:hypothetical protein